MRWNDKFIAMNAIKWFFIIVYLCKIIDERRPVNTDNAGDVTRP